MKKKSDVWACSFGCDVSRSACVHLEKLLPSMDKGKLRIVNGRKGAHATVDAFTWYHPSHDLGDFKHFLADSGFTDKWDVDMLVAKFFYGMTNKQITKEFNYTSLETQRRRLKELLKEFQRRTSKGGKNGA